MDHSSNTSALRALTGAELDTVSGGIDVLKVVQGVMGVAAAAVNLLGAAISYETCKITNC